MEKGNTPVLNLDLSPFYRWGAILLLLISPLLRGLFFPADLLPVQMGWAVLFALAIYDQLLYRDYRWPLQPLDLSLFALIAAYAFSLLTAVHPRPAAGEFLEMVYVFCIYWTVVRSCTRARDKGLLNPENFFLKTLFISAVIVALVGIASATGYVNFPGAFVQGTILSTLQYKNALAVFLAAANAIGLALSLQADHPAGKCFYGGGNFLLALVILGTQSRGGWIVYPLALTLLIFLVSPRYRWRAIYHTLIFLTTALFSAKYFIPLIAKGTAPHSLKFVFLGLATSIILQLCYHALGEYLSNPGVMESTRRLVAYGGIGYLALVLTLYLIFARASFVQPLEPLLPAQVTGRLETIATGQTTLPARYQMYADAISVATTNLLTGTGGGGWNALYHRYQDYPYWTTEVHNHYLQVLVEAGLPGFVAFFAIWFFFLLSSYKLWRREGFLTLPLAGAVTAAITLGVHAAFDFDFSLPALTAFWACCLALIRAQGNYQAKGYHQQTQNTNRKAPEANLVNPVPENTLRQLNSHRIISRRGALHKLSAFASRYQALIAFTAGTFLAILLFFPSARFYSAGLKGAEAARNFSAGKLEQAAVLYEEAIRLDPFTASYHADLAQINALRKLETNEAAYHFMALKQARRAAELEPYNLQLRAALTGVYSLLNEHELAVKEAVALRQAHPLLAGGYEAEAGARLAAAFYHLQNNRSGEAREHLQQIINIYKSLPVKRNQQVLVPVSATINTAAGKAYLLLGDPGAAVACLEQAARQEAKNKNVQEDLLPWRITALRMSGRIKEAEKLMPVSGNNTGLAARLNAINKMLIQIGQ